MLDRISRSGSTKAVIVTIGSPGGTVPGSEALFDSLRKVAQRKPTVAVVSNMAASGGYIAALGTDRIFAKQTSLVGSIGVLFQYPDVSRLLDTVGVKVEQIKSTPLKAEPSGFAPTSEPARAAVTALVSDTFNWFKGLVKSRRNLDDALLDRVADGRVFTGRQALELKLVDAIGGETEALDWLVAEKKIARRLPVRDWRPSTSGASLGIWSWAASAARFAGFEDVARTVERSADLREFLANEGLLAVWYPPTER
jgi:protease-4